MTTEIVDDEALERFLRASPVFGGLGPDVRTLLRSELEMKLARRGDVLIRQGDEADGLYLVASGRLQVILAADDGSRTVLNEVGRGEVTGEMALLTDSPRAASIVALRDSHVFFLSTDAFGRVLQAHPEALRVISSAVIGKLMDTIRHSSRTSPATTIAVVPLDESEHARDFGSRLAQALRSVLGTVAVASAADAQAHLGDTDSELGRAVWRDQLEGSHGVVVYVADPSADSDEWTHESVQAADIIVYAAWARGPHELRAIEHSLRVQPNPVAQRTEIVLLHDPSTTAPRGTRHWLAPRRVDRHHHVRVDRPGDYARVARLLTGHGTGVVFSGGGARGIAHIGALRAMAQLDLPIDAAAGASIGAIVAGAVARGDDPDSVAEQMRAAVVDRSPVDLTFPTVSFASGGRVTHHIKEGAQGLDLEDTWLNFFCVSTNLTRGALEIHDRGEAWAAVRSSFSVPGLFPPMHNENGDVLVDGGILDNLPVAPMRLQHAGISVVALDVGARREFMTSSTPSGGVVSGWRFLAQNLRDRRLDNLASLPRILMRLTELGALGDDDHGDCYVRLDLAGVSLLDFDKFDALIGMGERDSLPKLREWMATRDLVDLNT